MSISQADLARLFLCAFLLGAGLGMIYDVFRITRVFLGVHYSRRMAKRLRNISFPLLPKRGERRESRLLGPVIFLQDLIFCVFCGISLVLLFYEVNSGKFRLSATFCVGGGFLLYRVTLGRIVMLFSEAIAYGIEIFVRYLFFFFMFPWRWLARMIKRGCKALAERVQKKRQKSMRKRYTVQQLSKLNENAFGMLPYALPKDQKRKLKRGSFYGKGKKEAIQPIDPGKDTHRTSGRGLHRRVCK